LAQIIALQAAVAQAKSPDRSRPIAKSRDIARPAIGCSRAVFAKLRDVSFVVPHPSKTTALSTNRGRV
jgi:hypothetical protein